MAKIEAGQEKVAQAQPAWGCTCMAFRMRPPELTDILKAAVRATTVQVKSLCIKDGAWHFEAWTDPDERYQVVFDPLSPSGGGGFCKHTIACAALIIGGNWLQQLFEKMSFLYPEYTNRKGLKHDRKESGVQDGFSVTDGFSVIDLGPDGTLPPL